ncbi:hypothetical protein N752_13735 [Desulforamulus aquiferis]|nr:hypothetical protein N752_13735 [Desulforamulus aquiferis]
MVPEAIQAAEILHAKGVRATVINARFIKPLDQELIIKYAKVIKNIVTIEEHVLMGGFGSAVIELLESEGINDVAIKCIGLPDRFIEHGKQDILRANYASRRME